MKIKIETVKDSESARRSLKEEALSKGGYTIASKQNMHEAVAMFYREEDVITIKTVEGITIEGISFIHWIDELVTEYEIERARTREKEMSNRAMNDETILYECTH